MLYLSQELPGTRSACVWPTHGARLLCSALESRASDIYMKGGAVRGGGTRVYVVTVGARGEGGMVFAAKTGEGGGGGVPAGGSFWFASARYKSISIKGAKSQPKRET